MLIKGMLKQELIERESVRFVKKRHWTDEDERERVRKITRRAEYYAHRAKIGVNVANVRVKREKGKLWFQLQTPEVQAKLVTRKAAKKKAEANSKERRRHIHFASFHDWDERDMKGWIRSAVASCLRKGWEIKRSAIQTKKKLDMYQEERLELTLMPFTKDIMYKTLGRYGYTCNAAKAEGLNAKLSAFEVEQDWDSLFTAVSRAIAQLLCEYCDCRVLSHQIVEAQQFAEKKMTRSSLASMLSPLLFKIRKTKEESEALARQFEELTLAVTDFANEILVLDPEWPARVVMMCAIAFIDKHDTLHWLREKGTNAAASRIAALARQKRTRNLIAAIKKRSFKLHKTALRDEAEERLLRIQSGNTIEGDIKLTYAEDREKRFAEASARVYDLYAPRVVSLTRIVPEQQIKVSGTSELGASEAGHGLQLSLSLDLAPSNFGFLSNEKRKYVGLAAAVTLEPCRLPADYFDLRDSISGAFALEQQRDEKERLQKRKLTLIKKSKLFTKTAGMGINNEAEEFNHDVQGSVDEVKIGEEAWEDNDEENSHDQSEEDSGNDDDSDEKVSKEKNKKPTNAKKLNVLNVKENIGVNVNEKNMKDQSHLDPWEGEIVVALYDLKQEPPPLPFVRSIIARRSQKAVLERQERMKEIMLDAVAEAESKGSGDGGGSVSAAYLASFSSFLEKRLVVPPMPDVCGIDMEEGDDSEKVKFLPTWVTFPVVPAPSSTTSKPSLFAPSIQSSVGDIALPPTSNSNKSAEILVSKKGKEKGKGQKKESEQEKLDKFIALSFPEPVVKPVTILCNVSGLSGNRRYRVIVLISDLLLPLQPGRRNSFTRYSSSLPKFVTLQTLENIEKNGDDKDKMAVVEEKTEEKDSAGSNGKIIANILDRTWKGFVVTSSCPPLPPALGSIHVVTSVDGDKGLEVAAADNTIGNKKATSEAERFRGGGWELHVARGSGRPWVAERVNLSSPSRLSPPASASYHSPIFSQHGLALAPPLPFALVPHFPLYPRLGQWSLRIGMGSYSFVSSAIRLTWTPSVFEGGGDVLGYRLLGRLLLRNQAGNGSTEMKENEEDGGDDGGGNAENKEGKLLASSNWRLLYTSPNKEMTNYTHVAYLPNDFLPLITFAETFFATDAAAASAAAASAAASAAAAAIAAKRKAGSRPSSRGSEKPNSRPTSRGGGLGTDFSSSPPPSAGLRVGVGSLAREKEREGLGSRGSEGSRGDSRGEDGGRINAGFDPDIWMAELRGGLRENWVLDASMEFRIRAVGRAETRVEAATTPVEGELSSTVMLKLGALILKPFSVDESLTFDLLFGSSAANPLGGSKNRSRSRGASRGDGNEMPLGGVDDRGASRGDFRRVVNAGAVGVVDFSRPVTSNQVGNIIVGGPMLSMAMQARMGVDLDPPPIAKLAKGKADISLAKNINRQQQQQRDYFAGNEVQTQQIIRLAAITKEQLELGKALQEAERENHAMKAKLALTKQAKFKGVKTAEPLFDLGAKKREQQNSVVARLSVLKEWSNNAKKLSSSTSSSSSSSASSSLASSSIVKNDDFAAFASVALSSSSSSSLSPPPSRDGAFRLTKISSSRANSPLPEVSPLNSPSAESKSRTSEQQSQLVANGSKTQPFWI